MHDVAKVPKREIVKDVSESASSSRLISGKEGTVTGGSSTKLGKDMLETMGVPKNTKWTGYQAQHIIPAEMNAHPVLQKIGMNLDDAYNCGHKKLNTL